MSHYIKITRNTETLPELAKETDNTTIMKFDSHEQAELWVKNSMEPDAQYEIINEDTYNWTKGASTGNITIDTANEKLLKEHKVPANILGTLKSEKPDQVDAPMNIVRFETSYTTTTHVYCMRWEFLPEQIEYWLSKKDSNLSNLDWANYIITREKL